jgi:MYXO-CTERM domain-containing protein
MGEAPPGAVRGELGYSVATLDDGTSETRYYLHPPGRNSVDIPLLFDLEPDLPSGAKIDVWGLPENGQLRVRKYEVLRTPSDIAEIERAVITGAAYRARSFAFAVVRIAAPPATPIAIEDARRRLFGTTVANTPSVRQYYVEVSYGRQDIAGDIFGPFEYPMMGNCGTSALATALRGMIPGTYNHYLWYMEPRNGSCGWSGLASGGTPDRPSRDTWYNNSAGCVVLVQEPGHNFGMSHSSSMRCPNNANFVDEPNGVCTHSEYGDRYDPMGGGCFHMNSFQKAYQGWFDKCNVVESPANGTYTLLPTELPCDGVQVIQVPMPHARLFASSGGGGGARMDMLTHYFVEMRGQIGIDKNLTGAPVVQIRVSGDLRNRSQRGQHSWFLDMNPATTTLDGLHAGETFTDPTGSPKITVEGLDGMKASVRVEVMGGTGAATCLDNTPLVGAGPGPESCAAMPAVPSATPPVIPDGGSTGGAGGGSGTGGTGGRATDAATSTPGRDAAVIPPGRDAATPTGGAGGRGTGGAGGGGGSGEIPPPSTDAATGGGGTVGGGCGCRVGAHDSGGALALLVLGLGLALIRRRR